MIAFYLVPLPKCPCGKPATHKVQATGNVDYVRAACKKCAERRLRELRAAHADAAPVPRGGNFGAGDDA